MKTILLIYLLIGTLLSVFLELSWKYLDEDKYTWTYRILTILCWPVILFMAVVYMVKGDDDDKMRLSGGH